MSVEEAAYAALTIATENVIGAIREITIAQGIDPREYSLVAGGGASGLNVVPIARELGSQARAAALHGRRALGLRRALLGRDLGVLAQPLRRDAHARPRRRQRGAGRHRGARRRVPRRSRRHRPGRDAQGVHGRGPLPRADLGARRAHPEPHPRRRRGRARGCVPRDARARLRRARAGPVPRVPALEGARDGRAAQARRAPARRGHRLARAGARRSRVLPRDGARPGAQLRRRHAAARRAHRGPRADPRADHDRRRLPRLDRSRSARSATTCWRCSREPRSGAAGGDRQPHGLDRPRDGEHAPAQRPLGRAQPGARLLLRARHRRQRGCSPPPRACRCT